MSTKLSEIELSLRKLIPDGFMINLTTEWATSNIKLTIHHPEDRL